MVPALFHLNADRRFLYHHGGIIIYFGAVAIDCIAYALQQEYPVIKRISYYPYFIWHGSKGKRGTD